MQHADGTTPAPGQATLVVAWGELEEGKEATYSITQGALTLSVGHCWRVVESCSTRPQCRRYYAVANGPNPGVYDSYAQAILKMGPEAGVLLQRFDTEDRAIQFVKSKGKGAMTQITGGTQPRIGALPNRFEPLTGVKLIASQTLWHSSSRSPPEFTDAQSVSFLEDMGFAWDSCPLAFDYKRNKKIVRQTKRHNRGDTGIYLHCAESAVSVVDIDGSTKQSADLLRLLAGECNMVSFTLKGIHLFFRYTPDLPSGYANPEACALM